MCMFEGADGYNTFSSSSNPKARKQHRCNECRRTIEIGERYCYYAWLFEGDFGVSKTCLHCQVAGEWLQQNCGGYLVGSVLEDIEEHVHEYHYKPAPACIPRLMRLRTGMRQKWLIKRGPSAGKLMPIPTLPALLEPLKQAA